MPDELDARLLRDFAASQRPLAGAQFVAQITAQLQADGWRAGQIVRAALRALQAGLAAGIATPLRPRYATLVALAAGAATVWSVLQGI